MEQKNKVLTVHEFIDRLENMRQGLKRSLNNFPIKNSEQTLKDIAAKHGWRKSMPFGMGAAIHCDFYKWFDTDHVVTNYDEAKQCNTEAEGVYHVYTVGKQPTKRKFTKEALTQISPELLTIIVP
jgi:hypothetical protein